MDMFYFDDDNDLCYNPDPKFHWSKIKLIKLEGLTFVQKESIIFAMNKAFEYGKTSYRAELQKFLGIS